MELATIIEELESVELATIIIAFVSLIISILSFIFMYKGEIILNSTPSYNNLTKEKINTNKFLTFNILITNTYLKTISLYNFSVMDKNRREYKFSTRLYLSPKEEPLIKFVNIPPGETIRITVKARWEEKKVPKDLLMKYMSSNTKKEKIFELIDDITKLYKSEEQQKG